MDLRPEDDIDLRFNEDNRRSKRILSDGQEYTYYNLSDKSKKYFIKLLKKIKYDDFKNMVQRLELTKSDILDILGLKYIPLSTTGCTLQPYNMLFMKLELLTYYYNLCYPMM